MATMQDAVIVSAARTAVARGKSDGALARAGVLPIDISALVMKEAVRRAGVTRPARGGRGLGVRDARGLAGAQRGAARRPSPPAAR
jgi:hypothetical protein